MIRYRLVKWIFNSGAWANVVREAVDTLGIEMVADIMQVHQHTIRGWMKMKSGYEEFPYPNMTNFLKLMNELDKDPRDFFILEDVL